jgi:hypothetical protein
MRHKPTSFESLKANGGYKSGAGKLKRHRFDLSGVDKATTPDNPLKEGALPDGGNQGYAADDGRTSVPDSDTEGPLEGLGAANDTLPGGPVLHAPNATVHVHIHPAQMHALKRMQKSRFGGY